MASPWLDSATRLLVLAGTDLTGKDHLRIVPTQLGREVVWQAHSAIYWFEKLLSEIRPASLLELGTLNGGLTVLFGLHLPDRVVTVDLADCALPETKDLHRRLGIERLLSDIFGDEVRRRFLAMPQPRFVFCDGGDKAREFATFAPILGVGDAIAVHDVGAEFFPDSEEARRSAEVCGLERLYAEDLLADGTLLAAYRKVR